MHPYRKSSDINSDALAVVYVEGATTVETILARTGRSMYGGQTVREIKKSHPGKCVTVMPWADAWIKMQAAQAAKYCKPLREITESEFNEALNVLPPEKWTRCETWEAFRISEYTCGRITQHYLRVGSRYFTQSRPAGPTAYAEMWGAVTTMLDAEQTPPVVALVH